MTFVAIGALRVKKIKSLPSFENSVGPIRTISRLYQMLADRSSEVS